MRNFLTGLIVFGVIIACILLQLNVFNLIPLFGVKANMGIILVVALSILCGKSVGVSVGIAYGVLSDIFWGKVFGVYTLLFLLVGFFCGKMSRGFSKENKTALVMSIAGTTLVFEILSYLLFVLIYGYEMELFVVIKTILLECIYHMVMARTCFSFFSNLAETINKGKRSYYLL